MSNSVEVFVRQTVDGARPLEKALNLAELEAAARGGLTGQPYPWGAEAPDAGGRYRANYNPGDFAADGFAKSAPAG